MQYLKHFLEKNMFFGVPIASTADILNLTLAIGFLVLVFFIVIVLIRVFIILGNVRDITETVAEIVEVVNHYLWRPVQFFTMIMNKIKKFIKKRK